MKQNKNEKSKVLRSVPKVEQVAGNLEVNRVQCWAAGLGMQAVEVEILRSPLGIGQTWLYARFTQ